MSWRIVLSDVRISADQRAAALGVLESGWLSMGPRTAEFELAFAQQAGVDHAVAVSSGTSGLLLALQAVGVRAGDEVVLPSLTFVADANVVRSLGAVPVFADVCGADQPLVDVDDLLAACSPRTRAVLVVHYAGAPVDVSRLTGHGVAVVEDAAHAVGPVADDGHWLPLRGDVAVFSFFANKNLPLGEGGMVTTRDPALAQQLRLLRSHGMTTGTWDRHRGHAYDYDVVALGSNARTTELQAAMGTAALVDLPAHNAARRRLLATYAQLLEGTPVRLALAGQRQTTGHLAVAVLPQPGMRAAVRASLADAGIQSSFHYPPIHMFQAYADLAPRALPRTEDAAERLVTLPLHPYLSDEDVDLVVSTLRAAL